MNIAGSCCTPSAGRSIAPDAAPLTTRSADDPAERMVALPGCTFLMGTDYARGFPEDGEGPVREVTVNAFSIDRTPVTNELFARFITATGFRTDAERFGWSFVFYGQILPERRKALVEDTLASAPWWCKLRGARWDAPEGPGSDLAARAQHPVVHVSWNDAAAYAAWAGQRLPNEAEWEYAARGGLVQKLYPWGDALRPGGRHLCNIWQGEFPYEDTAEDGFAGTCPVDAFPPNGFGLLSVTGNTWEWTADAWAQGKDARVTRGGSFLCHASYCNRYRVAARTSNTPDSTASNTGFRCAR